MIGSSRFDFKYPLAKGVHRAAVHWNDWLVGMVGVIYKWDHQFLEFLTPP